MNGLGFSLSYQRELGVIESEKQISNSSSSSRSSFFQINKSIGFQEFGGTSGPTFRSKYFVNALDLRYGHGIRNTIFLSAGLGLRRYESFADSIANNPNLKSIGVDPFNIFLITGIEAFFGKLSLQVDAGWNIHKPFYPHYAAAFGEKNKNYRWKKRVPNRVGINYSFKDISPNGNKLKVGLFANTNFGQADFMDLTLTYWRKWQKTKRNTD